MSSNYWSSTTNANNTNNAWHVNFNNGNDNNNNKSNSYYVRAVRGGKCSLLSFAALYQAYLDCRQRKRSTINALRFEYRLLANLFELALEIQNGTYQPSRSVCFVTTIPKTREIFAADFRDRIVHHLVVRELEKIWEPKFIHDSCASRKGKGTHFAVERLRGFMRRATRSGKVPAWYLQLDIRSFFMSIDKKILFAILERNLDPAEQRTQALLYLLRRIIFHDCTGGYLFKGDPAALDQVPPHKSLFHVPAGKGLPIGNLTSQFFANVYLNELDQFVKHRLKCRYYIRYVDDCVLVADNPAQLESWRSEIEEFLARRLSLQVKAGAVLRRVADGADFLGYIVRPDYLLARRRVVNNLKARLAGYAARIVSTRRLGERLVTRIAAGGEAAVQLRQTLASYLGHFRHADA
ncbi:MAG: reverse transcriptase/maturase family protein [Desulfobulbaceae bacterium]